MAFEIERGIELPNWRGGMKRIYPFGDMQVGDSFAFPTTRRNAVNARAYEFGKRNGMKFCTRSEGDTCRIWRIS